MRIAAGSTLRRPPRCPEYPESDRRHRRVLKGEWRLGISSAGPAVVENYLDLREIRPCTNILVSKHQCEAGMSRLTITLSEARYRALKEASVQRDKTIGQLVDESLEFYGIKSREDARDLVRRARAHSKLTEDQVFAVAQEEVRTVRRKP